MPRKKFDMDEYNRIKEVLKNNNIDSKKLAQYEVMKHYRYLRHSKQVDATDEQLLSCVLQEDSIDNYKTDDYREPTVNEIKEG